MVEQRRIVNCPEQVIPLQCSGARKDQSGAAKALALTNKVYLHTEDPLARSDYVEIDSL